MKYDIQRTSRIVVEYGIYKNIYEYRENGVVIYDGPQAEVHAKALGRLLAKCEMLEKKHGDLCL